MNGKVVGIVVGVIALGALALFLLNRDSDSTNSSGTVTTVNSSGAVTTVNLKTSDGLDVTLDVDSCDNPGETTISLTASSETSDRLRPACSQAAAQSCM